MTEHLFKLKKDGKTVGYFKFAYCDQKDCINAQLKHYGIQFSKDCQKWQWNFTEPIYYSVHPFVTKDKNKKDIYRGDETNKGIAIAAFKDWVWTYKKDPSTYHWHINIKEDIELIEDKDNE